VARSIRASSGSFPWAALTSKLFVTERVVYQCWFFFVFRGLFGLTTLKESDKSIFITEGEFDAMAVYQMTGFPAVSLPTGAHGLPTDLLPFFDRFERIYLWLDADEVGQLAAEKFAHVS